MYSARPSRLSTVPVGASNLALDRASKNNDEFSATSSTVISVRPLSLLSTAAGESNCSANLSASARPSV